LLNQVQESQFHMSVAELRLPSSAGANDLPKRKRTWSVKELSAVDAGGDQQGFELEFEKGATVSWTAVNVDEKKRFLSTLINLNARHDRQRHKKKKLGLKNVPEDIMLVDAEDAAGGSKARRKAREEDEEGGRRGEEDYEPVSTREAADFMAMMEKCEHAVTNADVFAEDLARELSVLDGANIHSIMASEESVASLMDLLERALEHTEAVEARLDQYDDLLEHIRDSMDKMAGKTVSIETVNSNNKTLLETLERVLRQLDVPYKYQQALAEPELSSPKRLKECILGAKALQRALTADVEESLRSMAAVQDQLKRCEKLRDRFAKAVCRHLSNLFVHHGNDTDLRESGSNQLKLIRRKNVHKDLMKYAELVHWLKDMDPKGFDSLQSLYRENMARKLYEKDVRRFFEAARYRVGGGKPLLPVAGSSADLSKKGARLASAGGVTGFGGSMLAIGGGQLLGTDADSVASDHSSSERDRFDEVLETVLVELEDLCMDEQFFSIHFFKMEQVAKGGASKPDPKKDKKALEEARSMMSEIFPSLETELLGFVSSHERVDAFYTLHALVRLSRHVLSAQDTGSFLAITFGTALVQIKRNFDRFMQLQLRSVEEAKPPKRQKCGILPFVSNFESFFSTTDAIFKASERRSDLEKWYATLVTAMVNSVARISREHGKTPAEVVKMENFHHLHALLAQMKIAALDPLKKELKARYSDALRAYVTQYFGRPLDKLNSFFEGVQKLVAAGVKESEVGYQLAYSKQELRKVIANYPSKEVKKGLESLYKKVERHLSEEESLTQVVWRAMQEEFISQYKNVEDLMQRCYPGAGLALDFAIEDVLAFFSDIARSH